MAIMRQGDYKALLLLQKNLLKMQKYYKGMQNMHKETYKDIDWLLNDVHNNHEKH